MARKIYAIQVSDFRGNWITVKDASLMSEVGVLEELERERSSRGRRLRAVDMVTKTVFVETARTAL